jgi:transposase-like protein
MTHQANCTLPVELTEKINSGGLGSLPELIQVIVNNAMQVEREKYLQARHYERSEKRSGYANGYKPKRVKTRMGEIDFEIPQVREGGFYPSALEKGIRSERALTISLAEMYVQGVSTRKVRNILESLCGTQVSTSQVSRAAKEMDNILQAWRERPLEKMPYVFVDARYEKVRDNGQIRDAAVLMALGIKESGQRQVLGVSVSLSEQEMHWRTFLRGLQQRGLTGVELITSDDHAGLQAARRDVFGSTPWQRCQFHIQQNAQSYVPRMSMRAEVAADIRAIFNAPDRKTAELLLSQAVNKYAQIAPRLSTWMEENIPESLTVFGLPIPYRRSLRTTNGLERINREIRRRTRVVGIFPNEASCLRLISALLMEISEDWEVGRKLLKMKEILET